MVDNQLGARAHVFIIQLQEQYTHSSASLKGGRRAHEKWGKNFNLSEPFLEDVPFPGNCSAYQRESKQFQRSVDSIIISMDLLDYA